MGQRKGDGKRDSAYSGEIYFCNASNFARDGSSDCNRCDRAQQKRKIREN